MADMLYSPVGLEGYPPNGERGWIYSDFKGQWFNIFYDMLNTVCMFEEYFYQLWLADLDEFVLDKSFRILPLCDEVLEFLREYMGGELDDDGVKNLSNYVRFVDVVGVGNFSPKLVFSQKFKDAVLDGVTDDNRPIIEKLFLSGNLYSPALCKFSRCLGKQIADNLGQTTWAEFKKMCPAEKINAKDFTGLFFDAEKTASAGKIVFCPPLPVKEATSDDKSLECREETKTPTLTQGVDGVGQHFEKSDSLGEDLGMESLQLQDSR